MKMVRRSRALLLTMASAIAVTALSKGGAQGQSSDTQVVKIGVIAPLSGTQPARGKIIEVAASLAIDDLNAENKGKRKYEMVLLDDGNITHQAVTAAQRLIRNDNVIAITGIISSSSQKAIQPLAERAMTPVVGMIATATGLTDGFEYAFRATGSNDTIGPQITDFIKRSGVTKAAIIGDDSTYAQSLVQEAIKGAKAVGITITATEVYKTGTADVTAQVANIRRSGAEAVIAFPIVGADAATIARTMVENGLKLPIYGHNALFTSEAIKLGGSYFAQLPAVHGAGSVDVSRPIAAAFYARMDKAAGFKVPQNEDAAQTYDAIRLISLAVNAADGQRGKPLRDALEKIQGYVGIAGAEGSAYGFSPTNHTGLTGKYLVQYKYADGAFAPVN
ncbi:MAG: ABC transporter substrate-binding protein [Hyphomicrobiaceae bacterium]